MRPRLAFFLPLLSVLLLFLTGTAHAAPAIDDSGAAKLKAILESLSERQTAMMTAKGLVVTPDGPVTVTKADGYYSAFLPALAISDVQRSLQISIGKIAINASQADAPGQWNLSVAIPSPIRLSEREEGIDLTLSIGGQNTRGVWLEDLRNFITLDSRLENVSLSDSKKTFQVSIPQIVTLYDLKEKSPDLWSGPSDILVKGLNFTATPPGASNPVKVSVGEISMKSTIQDLSIKAMAKYREQLETLASTTEATAGSRSVSPAHAEATMKLLVELLRNVWDGFSGDLVLRDLAIDVPDQTPGNIRLKQAHFGMDMAGFRTGKVSMGLRFGHDSLELLPEDASFGPLVPTTASIDLRLEKLPFQELTDLGLNSFKMAQKMPGMEQMIGLQILSALPQLMSAAGTKITFHENRVSGKMYDVTIEGHAIANGAALHGVTGKARIEIAGLETLIAHLNRLLEKSSGAEHEELSSRIGMLTMVQAMGQQGKNAKGQSIRIYDFVVDDQGRMLLNGADFNALMGAQQDEPVGNSGFDREPSPGRP